MFKLKSLIVILFLLPSLFAQPVLLRNRCRRSDPPDGYIYCRKVYSNIDPGTGIKSGLIQPEEKILDAVFEGDSMSVDEYLKRNDNYLYGINKINVFFENLGLPNEMYYKQAPEKVLTKNNNYNSQH